MKELILYILLIMIFYDFSLHLLELFLGLDKVKKLKPYWPSWLFIRNKKFDRKLYTIFWILYWLLALILLLSYILMQ